MPAEFDRYASAGYSTLLSDPIRGKFAGSEFFFQRKLQLLRELCEQYGTGTKSAVWLDVGCGEGTLLRMGKEYFRDVAGCDVSQGMMEHCQGLNVRQQELARQIPFEDGDFDLVTAICAYHHVPIDVRGGLTADISRVLRPKGIFCVIEHNPFNPLTQLIVRRSPIDSNAHLLSARATRRLVRAAGMKVMDTRYFLFLPERLYSKMPGVEGRLSSIPLGGQYAVSCRKI